MNWAQITLIVLLAIGLADTIDKHGKEKKGKHNFWLTLLATGILVFFLIMAGTFNK